MSTRNPDEILKDVVTESLQEMTFLDVEKDSDPIDPKDVSHIFHIGYSYPEVGALMLYLPKELKIQIVENIYGENWTDLTPNQIDDSLLEILNVIGGKFLTEVFGDGGKYIMGLPNLVFDESAATEGLEKEEFHFTGDAMKFKIVWLKGQKK